MAAILAGGASRRMGSDKALLPFRGRPLILHVIERLQPLFSDILIVGRQPEWLFVAIGRELIGVRCIPDALPGLGPASGLLTAMDNATAATIFLCGCDMPFIQPNLVRYIVRQIGSSLAAVPEVSGRMQPLHAAYSLRARGELRDYVNSGELSMHNLIRRLNPLFVSETSLRSIDPQLLSFANMNSPEDLVTAEYEGISPSSLLAE